MVHYKQKNKYFLFITIILLFLFFNPNTKTRFLFKGSVINILQITLRNETTIFQFLTNFIYIYLPLLDSFSAEVRYLTKKNIVKFCFFKFPLLFELNNFFHSLEHLYMFLNSYKFQLEFHLKKQKNQIMHLNLMTFLKLPLLINS